MDVSTPLPEALQWSEGMLLGPQHLQQNDIYWQQQARHLMACLQPYYWGVVELAVSGTDLVGGTLRIERLHCVMPDGLVVQHPRPGDAPLRLDLKAQRWAEGTDLKVHLAVPLRTEGAASLTSAIQRYASVPGALEVDENTGENRLEVGRLRPRLELRPADEVSAKYSSFPLLELRRESSGAFALTGFHPPMLRLSASGFLDEHSSLQAWLAALATQARERATGLSAETEGGILASGGGPADAEARLRRLAVQHATKSLPAFELLVRSALSHPFDAYLGLAQLVGQIGALGDNPMPPSMEPYRHDDCLPGFRAALEFVEARLDELSLAFEWLPFARDPAREGLFTRDLPPDLALSTLIVELKPQPGQSLKELGQWLRQARIASDDLLRLLEQRRQPGALHELAGRRHVEGLILRPGRAVFALHNGELGPNLRMIRAGRPLCIEGPAGPLAPAAIALYRPRSGRNRLSRAA